MRLLGRDVEQPDGGGRKGQHRARPVRELRAGGCCCLLVKARAETDDAKRTGMYAEMQQFTHDDNGSIVLVFNNFVSAKTSKLAHGEIAANRENDGLKIADRSWMT